MKGGGVAIAGRGRAAALLALLLVAVSLHANAAVPRRLLEADRVAATQQQSPPLPAAKGHQPPPLLSVRQASSGPSCSTNDPHIHCPPPHAP
jgi:hypothetical protein